MQLMKPMLITIFAMHCFLAGSMNQTDEVLLFQMNGHANSQDIQQCYDHINEELDKIRSTSGAKWNPGVIGAIIGPFEGVTEACCDMEKEVGHDYKEIIEKYGKNGPPSFEAEDTLVVIDVQKDFVNGLFVQPCVNQKGDETSFVQDIVNLIEKAKEAKARVIASVDMHESGHCSFSSRSVELPHCANQMHLTMTHDAYIASLQGKDQDWKKHALHKPERYLNEFPDHGVFRKKGPEDPIEFLNARETDFCKQIINKNAPYEPKVLCAEKAEDFKGGELHDKIMATFKNEDGNEDGKPFKHDLHIVYKGFRQNYDSFSAYTHPVQVGGSGENEVTAEQVIEEQKWTGGYALKPEDRTDGVLTLPTPNMLENPTEKMIKFDELVKEKKGKVVVVGLVYDFCVKETASFMKYGFQNSDGHEGREVHTYVAHTRPSFDGRPGAPYFCGKIGPNGLLDFADLEVGQCVPGGGELRNLQAIASDYLKYGVKLM